MAAADAGAAMPALHARAPDDGRPCRSEDLSRSTLSGIKQRSDVVITSPPSAARHVCGSERLEGVLALKAELCNAEPRTITTGSFPMSPLPGAIQFGWEDPYLESTRPSRSAAPTRTSVHAHRAAGGGRRPAPASRPRP